MESEILLTVTSTVDLHLVSGEPEYGNAQAWGALLLQLFFLMAIIIVFTKNMITSNQAIKTNPERYSFWISSILSASMGSICAGFIGALISIYEVMINIEFMGESDSYWATRAVGESLVFLVIGFSIALLGTIFGFICRWKMTLASSTK